MEIDTSERLGAALGILVYHLGFRRKVVSKNLRAALGHLSTRKRQAAAKRCYANAGANLCNVFSTGCPKEPFGSNYEELNPEWCKAMGERYASAVYVSPHLGAYEVNAWMTIQHLQQERMLCYVRIQKDQYIDKIVNNHRKLCGADILFVRDDDKKIIYQTFSALKKGERSLNILADQGPRKKNGRAGHFLGHQTYCHHGPAIFARRARVPIIPCLCLRVGVAEYRYFCGRPIDCSGRDLDEIMQIYLDQLSAMIAAFPSQYYWHHKRFKRLTDEIIMRDLEPWKTEGLNLLVA